MRVLALRELILLGGLGSLLGGAAPTPSLTFEDRVRAQEAIERVYYSHQNGVTLAFENAVPRETLERKVRTYLRQSGALQEFWRTPITAEMLEHELRRMQRGTRFPERLREIYEALGNDPRLIRETFARASLADRLSRSFFVSDERIHGATRAEAETLRSRLVSGDLSLDADDPHRTVVTLRRAAAADPAAPQVPTLSLALRGAISLQVEEDEFARLRSKAPAAVGEIGAVTDERNAYIVRAVLHDQPDGARVAVYVVRKRPWDDWWREVQESFDLPLEAENGGIPEAVDSQFASLRPAHEITTPPASLHSSCVADDTWDNGVLDDAPDPRYGHTAVWTGSVMIIWGGVAGNEPLGTGGRYDPLTDTWTPVSAVNAPQARSGHTAVWTGTEMIVWGGAPGGTFPLNTGGRYDPVADVWAPTSTVDAPTGVAFHTAVWTGAAMVIWGGTTDPGLTPTNAGGRYDPVTDTWTPTSTSGAPSRRYGHTAVWTGVRMIVWGGGNSSPEGASYDPASDTWSSIASTGEPNPRWLNSAVWTGKEMVVWGGVTYITGCCQVTTNTGWRYDPVSDSWTAMSTAAAPSPRRSHTAVWTGSAMLVWGGTQAVDNTHYSPYNPGDGGVYDPERDLWTSVSRTNAPLERIFHTAVWTGDTMIVWGGLYAVSGGRYTPTTDSWTPTATSSGGPGPLYPVRLVWTGNEMIAWGQAIPVNYGIPDTTGGRCNPVTDSWSMVTTIDSPALHQGHSAVWTGREMIVWGADYDPNSGYANIGGRYDPIVDKWAPISLANAPAPRINHQVLWTGREMLVWGGGVFQPPHLANDGARYDPSTDTWVPLSTVGAPAAADDYLAVWSGKEMIVYRGWRLFYSDPGDGARYDPDHDVWLPMSLANAPEARTGGTAIWTGSRMLVWGGTSSTFPGYPANGGLYDPAVDRWVTPAGGIGSPTFRRDHTAVWAGSEMVVWGGTTVQFPYRLLSSGERYDPATNTWTPMTTRNAPLARWQHGAVWTGSFMLVWGGYNGTRLSSGGRYALGQTADDDLDGYSECAGDCNDTNPTVYPGAAQACDDHVNNDCSDPAWPSLRGTNEADDDGDSLSECQGDCDDSNPDVHPGASEICNGLDDDCDGTVPPSETDADGDGFRGCEDDCDDSDATVHPAAVELPGNAIDENCDGVLSCDPRGFYKTHGLFVACVAHACESLVSAQVVSRAECDALTAAAARSAVGRRQRAKTPPLPQSP